MDEFKRRFQAAKKIRKDHVESDAREVYTFCFNGRETEWDNRLARSIYSRSEDAEEIFTEAPATAAEDFAGQLLDTMMPENAAWVEYSAAGDVFGGEGQERDMAQEEVRAFEKGIDTEVKKSNFYDEALSSFMDAVVGNVQFWVDRPDISLPIRVRSLAMADCYYRLGPFGIDDRFLVERYSYRDLEALFPAAEYPDVKFSKKLEQKIKTSKTGTARVEWGFWLTYEDPANPQYYRAVRVDGEPIGIDAEIGSIGSCPFIAGRFNPRTNSPWGYGPGRRMLPTIRTLNETAMMNMEGMDRNLNATVIYPNDGFLDFSDGMESGMAYPSAPGSADGVREFGNNVNLGEGFYSEERLEQILRKGFFLDVEQRGKTPPSASQYLGEQSKVLSRLARPAKKTWREVGVGLLKRVEYLSKEVKADGGLLESGDIVVRPVSPLERAQAMEEVQVADGLMQMIATSLGPEGSNVIVNGPKTFSNMQTRLRDKIVEFRSEDEIKKIMEAQNAQQSPAPQQ